MKLRIGFDLDSTIYGFPHLFKYIIPALHAAGHKLFCTSNHVRHTWVHDEKILRELGIDPDMLDPSLMQQGPKDHGWAHKKWMSQHVDFMFDDFDFNKHTDTPVFVCPGYKAKDWQNPIKHPHQK